jgi:hypothetical protein
MNFNEKREKFISARDKLPEKLRDIYALLVDEYAYHAHLLYGRNWVAYEVLAALVKDGWTPPEKAEDTK